MALDVAKLESIMKSATARRRPSNRLRAEHREALKLLLTPDEVAKAREIEAEGAKAELRKRGVPVDEIVDEFARLQIQSGVWRPTWTK